MKKGKFGVVLGFYALAAFIFALFGNILPIVGITLFVIAVEKDEWSSKLCIEAGSLVVIKWIFAQLVIIVEKPVDWLGTFITNSGFYKFESIYDGIFSFLNDLTTVLVTVFIIIGIIKAIKGKEGGVPLVSKIGDWAYATVTAKPAPAPAQAPAPAAPAKKFCTQCGAEVTGDFCQSCGTKVN